MAIWGDGIGSDLEDFSPSSTIVPFDPPIPLLRGPIPAAPSDSPDAGPFVLAFSSASSWRSAFESTQFKIIDQCMKDKCCIASKGGNQRGEIPNLVDED